MEAEHPDNHGKEVSEFVHETELTGCEKGQAVAAIASGKEKDATHCKSDSTDADETSVDEVDEVDEEMAPETRSAKDEAKEQRRAQHEADKAEHASNQANRGK